MKKIIKFLPAMAILLASGLAVATTQPVLTPQYGFIDGQWEPISPTYSCSSPNEHDCTTTGFLNGVPQNVVKGTYSR